MFKRIFVLMLMAVTLLYSKNDNLDVFLNSTVKKQEVESLLNALNIEINGKDENISEMADTLILSAKLYDYFRPAFKLKNNNSDTISILIKVLYKKLKTVKNYKQILSKNGAIYKIDYLSLDLLKKNIAKNEKEIKDILKSINDLKKQNEQFNKLFFNKFKLSRVINDKAKDIIYNSSRGDKYLSKTLLILSWIGIGTDAYTFYNTCKDKQNTNCFQNGATLAIHSLQLNPLIGLATFPVELTTNYGVEQYNYVVLNRYDSFSNAIGKFDDIYFKIIDLIDNFLNNNVCSNTGKQDCSYKDYENYFFRNILFYYLQLNIGNNNSAFYNLYNTQLPKSGFLDILENIDFPKSIKDYTISKKGNVDLLVDTYLIRMPIKMIDNNIEFSEDAIGQAEYLTDSNNPDRWGWVKNENIMDYYINPLINKKNEINQKYSDYSKSSIIFINYLKDKLKKIKCEKDDFDNIIKKFNNKSNNFGNKIITECNSRQWKKSAAELWLISYFYKKLNSKYNLDVNMYLFSSLNERRLERINKDRYLNEYGLLKLSEYKNNVKNLLNFKSMLTKTDVKNIYNNIDLKEKEKKLDDLFARIVKFYYGIYKDIPFNYWAYPNIMKLKKLGLMTGFPDGTFRPKNKLTIGEFLAVFTGAMYGKNEQNIASRHNNYKFPKNYAAYLHEVKHLNIDYNSIINKLNSPATRGYVAKVIALTLNPNITYEKLDGDWDTYSDLLFKYDITAGKKRGKCYYFAPDDYITRAEFSVFMGQLITNKNSKKFNKIRKKCLYKVELPSSKNLYSEWIDKPEQNQTIDTYLNVDAKSGTNDMLGNYQCTELIKRFYKKIFNMSETNNGDGKDVAKKIVENSKKYNLSYNNKKVILKYFPSGSFEHPVNGSVISFYPNHVAIAKKVDCNNTKCNVYLFEQNYVHYDKNDKKYKAAYARKAIFTKDKSGRWSGSVDGHNAIGWTIAYYKQGGGNNDKK